MLINEVALGKTKVVETNSIYLQKDFATQLKKIQLFPHKHRSCPNMKNNYHNQRCPEVNRNWWTWRKNILWENTQERLMSFDANLNHWSKIVDKIILPRSVRADTIVLCCVLLLNIWIWFFPSYMFLDVSWNYGNKFIIRALWFSFFRDIGTIHNYGTRSKTNKMFSSRVLTSIMVSLV